MTAVIEQTTDVAMPGDIIVEERARRDLGDLQPLADSIARVSLLHPIVISTAGVLIAGQRRLRAWQLAFPDGDPIPVRVVDGFEDGVTALIAERDENTCRKDMTRTEQVDLGRRLEELESKKSLQRMAAAGRSSAPGRPFEDEEERCAPGSTPFFGKSRDAVGAALGISGHTYQRAKAVITAAESDPDVEVREVAQREIERMDDHGSVRGSFHAVREAQKKARPDVGQSPRTKPKPPQRPAHLRKMRHIDPTRVIRETVMGARGADFTLQILEPHHYQELELDDVADWVSSLTESIRYLNQLNRKLKELTQHD